MHLYASGLWKWILTYWYKVIDSTKSIDLPQPREFIIKKSLVDAKDVTIDC